MTDLALEELRAEYPGNEELLLYWCFADEEYLSPGMQETINDIVIAFISGDQMDGVGVTDTLYLFHPVQEAAFTALDSDFGIGAHAEDFEEQIALQLGGQRWKIPTEEEFRERVHDYTRYVIYAAFNPNLIETGFSQEILNRCDRFIGSIVWERSFVPGCPVRLIPFKVGEINGGEIYGFRFQRFFDIE